MRQYTTTYTDTWTTKTRVWPDKDNLKPVTARQNLETTTDRDYWATTATSSHAWWRFWESSTKKTWVYVPASTTVYYTGGGNTVLLTHTDNKISRNPFAARAAATTTAASPAPTTFETLVRPTTIAAESTSQVNESKLKRDIEATDAVADDFDPGLIWEGIGWIFHNVPLPPADAEVDQLQLRIEAAAAAGDFDPALASEAIRWIIHNVPAAEEAV